MEPVVARRLEEIIYRSFVLLVSAKAYHANGALFIQHPAQSFFRDSLPLVIIHHTEVPALILDTIRQIGTARSCSIIDKVVLVFVVIILKALSHILR